MATRVNKNIDWITDDEGFVVGYDRGLRRAVGIPRVSDDGQGLVFPDQSDPIARINERLGRLSKIRASIASAERSNPQVLAPWCAAPTWAVETAYGGGQVVRGIDADAVNLYLMAGNDTSHGGVAGTSAASGTGPSGTGSDLIVDGTCRWVYIGKATASTNTPFISTATLASASDEMNGALQLVSSTETTALGLSFYRPSITTGSYATEAFITGGVFNPSTGRVKGQNGATVASPSYSSASECGRIILRTNATRFLALRAQGSSLSGNRIIDFVVNGRHLSEASFVLPATSSSGFNTLLLNMAMFGPGEKTVEVHVQDVMPYSAVFEIGLEQDAAVWPKENPNRFKLTFEGDSICVGSFFTGRKPRFRLDRLIADMLGTDHHYNNAVGGTGAISDSGGAKTTYIQRLADVVEFGSDVHIIAGFHNDVGNDETYNSTTRQAAFLEYLQACRAQLPNATLVVIGALPLRGDTITAGAASLHQVELDAKAAFDALGDTNSLFIRIFTEARPRITSTAVGRYFMNATSPYDDGHPTPLFYPAIAALIAEKIKAFFAD